LEAYDVSLVTADACVWCGNCTFLSKSAILNFGLDERERAPSTAVAAETEGEVDLQAFA
jgi:hypothetical protein